MEGVPGGFDFPSLGPTHWPPPVAPIYNGIYRRRQAKIKKNAKSEIWKARGHVARLLSAFSFLPFPSAFCKDLVMPVPMELSRIIISEIGDQQMIYLKEIEGNRTFPIVIGLYEAKSIDDRVKRRTRPRPFTHDLIVSMVEGLGAEFQDVLINELKDHTYFAKIRVRNQGELVEIDARPSDAIAVAVTFDPPLPIFVNEEVLNDVLGD
jgi:hypothetical protein